MNSLQYMSTLGIYLIGCQGGYRSWNVFFTRFQIDRRSILCVSLLEQIYLTLDRKKVF